MWKAFMASLFIEDVMKEFGLSDTEVIKEGKDYHYNYYREDQQIPAVINCEGFREVYEEEGKKIPDNVMKYILKYEESLQKDKEA